MRFIKKLNLLDYVIFTAFFVTVSLGIYNFLPRERGECSVVISLNDNIKLKDGDYCFDIAGKRNLGKIKVLKDGFSVSFRGERGNNGIESGDRVYVINMPLQLYVGDYYAEGRVRRITCDVE